MKMKFTIFFCLVFLLSLTTYTQNDKGDFLKIYNQLKSQNNNNCKICPNECQPLNKYLDQLHAIYNSIDINATYSEAQYQQFRIKVINIVTEYRNNYQSCYNCIAEHQRNQQSNTGGQQQANPTTYGIYPEPNPAAIAAERAAQLSNALTNGAMAFEANAADKQNKLGELESMELGDKIQLQPKVPKEFHDQEKGYLENDLYGDMDTDKFDNSLGGDDDSFDDLFGDGDTKPESVVVGTSGQQVLFSDTTMAVSWSYQFVESQNCPTMGNPDAMFNMYKITGALTNLTKKTLRFTICCSEIRHFNTSTACGSDKTFASFRMEIQPKETYQESYFVHVPSGEAVGDPSLSLSSFILLDNGGPISNSNNTGSSNSIAPSIGQQTLYSDTAMIISWEYRYMKTLTCGVPENPDAKFNQYQVTAYLVSNATHQISFTECCTEVRHNHGNSGCGSTGGFARFNMRISPKSTNRETYQILVPEGQAVPDPALSVAGYVYN